MNTPTFSGVFGDHAVLQCERPVCVWGFAPVGEEVSLLLNDEPAGQAVTDAHGRWQIILQAQPPGGPHQLTVQSNDSRTSLEDIWFGEVWLASGQSNMAWPLADSADSDQALSRPNPHIHRLRIPGNLQPVADGDWFPAAPRWEAGADDDVPTFSAVGYHFADQLQTRLDRKVGVICSAYGGSAIEAWLPPRAFENDPSRAHLATTLDEAFALGHSDAHWQAEVDRFREWYFAHEAWHRTRVGPEPVRPFRHPGNPLYQSSATLLYRSMLRPLIPYTCRGVIWYQGESNVDDPSGYEDLFRRLITNWREDWQTPDWPFYFVQLAEYDGSGDWDGLRAAQARVAESVPHTGMAIAFDLGDKNDIHPRRKKPVGERLARLALYDTYGL